MQITHRPARSWIFAGVLLAVVMFVASDCGPQAPQPGQVPGAKPGAPKRDPDLWLSEIQNGDYATAIEQTNAFLGAYPGDAEALTIRGLAQLAKADDENAQGQPELAKADQEAAQRDLASAEAVKDQLPAERVMVDQVLLYRGLMVVNARLGQMDLANQYLDQAIQLAPAQQTIFQQELQGQVLSIHQLVAP